MFLKNDIILNKRMNAQGKVNWDNEEVFGYTLLAESSAGDVIDQGNPDFELVKRPTTARIRRTSERVAVGRVQRVRRAKRTEKKSSPKIAGFFN